MKHITAQKKLSSRVKFKLEDIIDLRENNWVPRFAENNPKTLEQIHKEAAMEAHEKNVIISQVSGRGPGGGLSRRGRASGELKKITTEKEPSPRVRLKLQGIIDLRENNWVPRSGTMSSGDNQLPPPIMWAQRKDILFLTISLEGCQEAVIELKPEYLHFRGVGGTQKLLHEIKADFYAEVDLEQSRYDVQPRHIAMAIRKKKEAPYWPRLMKQSAKVQWLKTDFNKWKNEDDSDDNAKDDHLADKMSSMIQYKQISPLDTNGVDGNKEDSDDRA